MTASCPMGWGQCGDSLVVQAGHVPAAAWHREANTPKRGCGRVGILGSHPLFGTSCRLTGVWVPLRSSLC